MGLNVRILTVALAAGLCAGAASAGRPGPPPEWSSRLSQPQLRPGALVTYRYDATSDDPLRLRVSVSAVSRQLRLAGKTSWLLAVSRRLRRDAPSGHPRPRPLVGPVPAAACA